MHSSKMHILLSIALSADTLTLAAILLVMRLGIYFGLGAWSYFNAKLQSIGVIAAMCTVAIEIGLAFDLSLRTNYTKGDGKNPWFFVFLGLITAATSFLWAAFLRMVVYTIGHPRHVH